MTQQAPLPASPSHGVDASAWVSSSYCGLLINLRPKALPLKRLHPFQSLSCIPSVTQLRAHRCLRLLLSRHSLLFVWLFLHLNRSLTDPLWSVSGTQPPSSRVEAVMNKGCRKAMLSLWNLTCQLPLQALRELGHPSGVTIESDFFLRSELSSAWHAVGEWYFSLNSSQT